MTAPKPCRACGRTDHAERAHRDPWAALEAGDAALEAGEGALALLWYETAKKLANGRRRELRWIDHGA